MIDVATFVWMVLAGGVGSAVAEGEKIAFRQGEAYRYLGTRYNPGTLAGITAGNLMRGAASNTALGISMGGPAVTNFVDYQWGEHRNVGVGSPEFAASTLVDAGKAGLTGVGAALIVAGGVLFFAAA